MDSADNPKARGLKHVKNKKKYNKKSAAHTACPKPKSVILDSNWDRYDKDNSEKTNVGVDFSLLANAPITQGSHFQFKSDKVFSEDENVDNESPLELFKLNLNLLEQSISTIPFSTRCEIDNKYFSETQHRMMDTTAKTNREQYVAYLQSLPQNSTFVDFFLNTDNETEESESEDLDLLNNTEYEESFLKEKEKSESEVSVEELKGNNENDLEQWLDTILDD